MALDRRLSALPDGSWALVAILRPLCRLQESSFPFPSVFHCWLSLGFAALSLAGVRAPEASGRALVLSTVLLASGTVARGRWASLGRAPWPASCPLLGGLSQESDGAARGYRPWLLD